MTLMLCFRAIKIRCALSNGWCLLYGCPAEIQCLKWILKIGKRMSPLKCWNTNKKGLPFYQIELEYKEMLRFAFFASRGWVSFSAPRPARLLPCFLANGQLPIAICLWLTQSHQAGGGAVILESNTALSSQPHQRLSKLVFLWPTTYG